MLYKYKEKKEKPTFLALFFLMSYFGKNIKKIRTVKKLSQTSFAEIFNLTRAAVGAYEEERAEAKTDTAIAIANYFSLTLDQLLTKPLSINEILNFNYLPKSHTPVPAGVNFISNSNHQTYIHYLKNKDLPDNFPKVVLPWLSGTQYLLAEVIDSEMSFEGSGIKPGDIVIGQKAAYKTVKIGTIYVVITERRFIIRRLIDKSEILELKAENPYLSDIQVLHTDILELWEVTGVITNSNGYASSNNKMDELLKSVENLHHKISDLEKKVVFSQTN